MLLDCIVILEKQKNTWNAYKQLNLHQPTAVSFKKKKKKTPKTSPAEGRSKSKAKRASWKQLKVSKRNSMGCKSLVSGKDLSSFSSLSIFVLGGGHVFFFLFFFCIRLKSFMWYMLMSVDV